MDKVTIILLSSEINVLRETDFRKERSPGIADMPLDGRKGIIYHAQSGKAYVGHGRRNQAGFAPYRILLRHTGRDSFEPLGRGDIGKESVRINLKTWVLNPKEYGPVGI